MTNETEYQRGYREGAEKMREDAAASLHESKDPALARTLCCSGYDCGCRGSSVGEYLAETHIRAIPITPPQPEARDDNQCREAFEEWAVAEGGLNVRKHVSGSYKKGLTLVAWEAWQAAWKEKSK